MNTFHHDKSVDYAAVKKEALENQPIITSFPLSAIELCPNKTIKIDGKLMPITNKAYYTFLKKVLKVDPKFTERFAKNTDERNEIKMLTSLKSGMAARKNEKVTVVANKNKKEITAFASGKHQYRSHASLFELYEAISNKYSELELRDCYIDDNGGVTLSARTNTERAPSFLQNEGHMGGLTFSNSAELGSKISLNTLRLICTNGMMGFGELPLMVGASEREMYKFFDNIKEISKTHWVSNDYFERLGMLSEVYASVSEVRRAMKLITSHLAEDEREEFERNMQSYLPVKEMDFFLHKAGIDIPSLNDTRAKNCPSGIKKWDLINALTDFGSHDYGYNFDPRGIQFGAGKMFIEKPDADGFVNFAF